MMKIGVAMSGGVDSSVAALLLKQGGYDLLGVTMRAFDGAPERDETDAAAVAARLGFGHITVDLCDKFRNTVMEYFAQSYMAKLQIHAYIAIR